MRIKVSTNPSGERDIFEFIWKVISGVFRGNTFYGVALSVNPSGNVLNHTTPLVALIYAFVLGCQNIDYYAVIKGCCVTKSSRGKTAGMNE